MSYFIKAYSYGTYTQVGRYQNTIGNGIAKIQLCFPNGFPYSYAPQGKCYQEGFLGSIPSSYGPCLPPIVGGSLVPPCNGQYFALGLNSYYPIRF